MTVVVLTPEELEALVVRAIVMSRAENAPTVMSTRQAAEVSGRSEKTVRNWISSGALPATRRGRTIAIKRADLDRFLAGDGERGTPSADALVAGLALPR